MRAGILIVVLLVNLAGAQTTGPGVTEEMPLENTFPDIVEEVKRGIAYLEIHTNVEGIARKGTAFLVHAAGILATCRHIVYDTSYYQGQMVVPDTLRIFARFHDRDNFLRAITLCSRADRDVAILLVDSRPGELDSLNLRPVQLATAQEIKEGVDVACTGYDLDQKTSRFGTTYYWLTTHRGIVSCALWIGPESGEKFLDFFQADIVVNRGASGSPLYLVHDGRVLGMIKGFKGRELAGISVNYGLANCVPAWAIAKLLTDWVNSRPEMSETK